MVRPNLIDDRVRDALRRAGAHVEPDVERLVHAVPTMIAEARRQRDLLATPAARVSAAGGVWLPRLAALAAVLALLAFIWPAGSPETATDPVSSEVALLDESTVLDQWIATGSGSEGVSDPVLDALVN